MTKNAKEDNEIVLRQDEIFFTCSICGRQQYESECEPSLFCPLCCRMVCSHCHDTNAGECRECGGYSTTLVDSKVKENNA